MLRLKIQHVKLLLLFFVTQTDKNHIINDQINCYLKTDRSSTAYNQTWGELIVNANALIMHSFFPVIQGND